MRFLIPLKGSIQSPTYSPDGKAFLFTRYRGGYGIGAADIYIADVRDRERVTLVTGGDLLGLANVASAGFRSTWTAAGLIIFETDVAGVSWPHVIEPNGQGLRILPGYDGIHIGKAPSFSPSGDEFVFERHSHGTDNPGEIVVSMVQWPTDTVVAKVVSTGNCAKPSWSPDGKSLLWQVKAGDNWRIAYHDIDSGKTEVLTPSDNSFYDPTWHPESDRFVCGGPNALYEINLLGKGKPLYPVEHPRTYYLGNPSWSPDSEAKRRRVMCEASDRDIPDGGPGTWLEIY